MYPSRVFPAAARRVYVLAAGLDSLVAAPRGAQGHHRRLRARHVRLLRLRDGMVPAHQVRLPIRLQLPRGRGIVEGREERRGNGVGGIWM